MIKKAPLIFFSLLILLIIGCDAANAPLKPYIEDATRSVIALSHSILTSHLVRDADIAIPPQEQTTISIALRNPRGFDLQLALEGPGSAKASAALSANKQSVVVTISNPDRLEVFDLTLRMIANTRAMPPYKLPRMEGRYLIGDLAGISVSPGSLDVAFNPVIPEYLLSVPYGTSSIALTALASPFSTSTINGMAYNTSSPATISVYQDMEISITVTADAGTSKTYSIRVNIGRSDSKAINGFYFGIEGESTAIDEGALTIIVAVPFGTDLANITPTVSHTGIQYSPSGPQDFYAPVQYTVTAADGTSQSYTVVVSVGSASSKEIIGFSFSNPQTAGVIDQSAKTITVSLPYGSVITNLSPRITHTGVSISPTGPQNFTSPVRYTVLAADGSSAEYTVTVQVGSSSSKEITSFTFASAPSTGVINASNRTIAIAVPEWVNRTSLAPIITHTGVSISPTGPQDFTNPVTFTVTAADKSTRSYTVTVSLLTVTGISITAPPAKTTYGIGDALAIAGLTVQAALSNGTTGRIPNSALAVSSLDSATVGPKTITVAYKTFAATFDVMVMQTTIFTIGFPELFDVSALNPSGTIILSKATSAGVPSVTWNLPGTYTNVAWIAPGKTLTGNSFTLNAEDYPIGEHFLTVILGNNGVAYSETIPFTVVY